jgi:hypothetical protein
MTEMMCRGAKGPGLVGGGGLACALAILTFTAQGAEERAERVYELRTYTVAAGKLPVLLERFGSKNLPLFKRAGITLEGAWTPADPVKNGEKLVYLVSFESRHAAAKAWKAFSDDPVWQALFAQEKVDQGNVVAKAESLFLAPTDYSPALPLATEASEAPARLFELRTYIASPGKLPNLNERFRKYTCELFERHGMKNVVYGVPMDEAQGSANTLVYLLGHANADAAKASWKAFSDDPAWKQVYTESQPDGVPLAAKVASVYLTPTRFSPMK